MYQTHTFCAFNGSTARIGLNRERSSEMCTVCAPPTLKAAVNYCAQRYGAQRYDMCSEECTRGLEGRTCAKYAKAT